MALGTGVFVVLLARNICMRSHQGHGTTGQNNERLEMILILDSCKWFYIEGYP